MGHPVPACMVVTPLSGGDVKFEQLWGFESENDSRGKVSPLSIFHGQIP